MKLVYLSILLVSCSSMALTAQPFSSSDDEGSMEFSQRKLGDINHILIKDMNDFIDLVEEAIRDGNKISRRLENKMADDGKLSGSEKKSIMQGIENIHAIYSYLNENREIMNANILQYNKDFNVEFDKNTRMIQKYNQALSENTATVNALLKITNRSYQQEADLKFSQYNVEIANRTLKNLQIFQLNVSNIRNEFRTAQEKFADFFTLIKNGEKTTGYLVDYFQTIISLEALNDVSDNLVTIDLLTEDIMNSIEQFANSILTFDSFRPESLSNNSSDKK